MAEPIRQITTTTKKPSSAGYDPYDLLFTASNPDDIFSEFIFGEGSAAPTEGMQADDIIEAIRLNEVNPKTLSPELKKLVKNRLVTQGVSEADASKLVGDDTTTFYDMENALALGAAKEAGLDFGGPFGAPLPSLGLTEQTDEEVLASIVAAAPSGTPLGKLSNEDLIDRYKEAVASLEYVQGQPRTLPGTGTYTKEGQDYLDEVFGDISDAKKEVAKYVDEINARGLDFPKEDTPYGGKVGTVIGPQGATTTVVWGDEAPNIPGTDTGIYTGSYRIPGGIIVDTGVSTGIPVLDDIIKAGAGQEVGGKVTITDVGLEEIARRTGIPVDDILEALEDSGIFGPPAPPGAQTQTPTQTQTGGAATQTGGTEEDTEGGGPFSAPVLVSTGGLGVTDIIEKLKDIFGGGKDDGSSSTGADTVDSGSTTDTVTTNGGATTDTTTTTGGATTDTTTTTGGATTDTINTGGGATIDTITTGGGVSDIVAGGGGSDIDTIITGGGGSDIDTITTGGGGSDIDTITTGGGGSDIDTITTGGGGSDIDTITTGGGASDIVAGGGNGSTIEAGSTIQTGGGGGFGMPTETPSATGQGLTGVSTEKAGVADIGDPYQLSASLYENIMRILQQDRENRRDDRNRARTYYGGGSVRASDRIDEIARIIRG
jgi:hypothetical protein